MHLERTLLISATFIFILTGCSERNISRNDAAYVRAPVVYIQPAPPADNSLDCTRFLPDELKIEIYVNDSTIKTSKLSHNSIWPIEQVFVSDRYNSPHGVVVMVEYDFSNKCKDDDSYYVGVIPYEIKGNFTVSAVLKNNFSRPTLDQLNNPPKFINVNLFVEGGILVAHYITSPSALNPRLVYEGEREITGRNYSVFSSKTYPNRHWISSSPKHNGEFSIQLKLLDLDVGF